MLNYRTQSVMENHNRKIAKVAESKECTSKESKKKKVEAVLSIFQEIWNIDPRGPT